MIIETLTKLIGPVPSYLEGVVYILSFFLVIFGLYIVVRFIEIIFSPFFRGW